MRERMRKFDTLALLVISIVFVGKGIFGLYALIFTEAVITYDIGLYAAVGVIASILRQMISKDLHKKTMEDESQD